MNQAGAKRWGARTRIVDRNIGKMILVEVAMECYATHGIEGTSIEHVTQGAGVSRRTFYRYFSEKKDLRNAVFSHCMDILFSAMRKALRSYVEDIPRLFEETVVFASTSAYPGNNNEAIQKTYDEIMSAIPLAMSKEWLDEWTYYYEDIVFASKDPRIRKIDPRLLAELASRLVTVYRQFGDCPEDIRKSLRTLKVLSRFSVDA